MKANYAKPGLILIVLFLGLISIRAQKVYNVLDYGALGDGISENAPSIQKAIDEAAASGGGNGGRF